jgi:hypothetical protein
METPHPISEKKGFKAYLFEGLMIFVAVMMGFFAESLRENISDKQKEREYISSLLHNLEQDTTFLKGVIRDNQKKIAGLDSLISLPYKDIRDPAVRRLLYRYSNFVSYYSIFLSNDATMMQLKNSGGLQYIKRNHVADSIAFYDVVVRSLEAAEVPYSKSTSDAMDAMSEVLVFRIQYDSSYFKNGVPANKDLPMLSTDPQKLEVFYNKVSIERGWTQNYLNQLQSKLQYPVRLIGMLKEEY